MSTATAKRGIEAQAIELETQLWEAIKQRDRAQMERLASDPYLYVMGDGITAPSRSEFIDMMSSDHFRLKSYRFDPNSITTRPLGNDAFVVAYRSHMDYDQQGQPRSADAFNSSTWIKEGGQWRCAATTESMIPAPR